MKTMMYALTFLIAATEAIPPDVVDPLVKMGPTAVMGAVLLFLVSKTLPAMNKQNAETIRDRDREFAAAVSEIADRQHDDSTKLNETMTQMRATCAAVQAASKT